MTQLIIGLSFLFITLIIFLYTRNVMQKPPNDRPTSLWFLGFFKYQNIIPPTIKLIISILMIMGLIFLWQVSFWFILAFLIIFFIVSFFTKALNSEGAKAAKIFNLYKRGRLDDPDLDEQSLLRKTAAAYFSTLNWDSEIIVTNVNEIFKYSKIYHIIDLVVQIFIIEFPRFLNGEEMQLRKKVIENSYHKVFKEKPPMIFRD